MDWETWLLNVVSSLVGGSIGGTLLLYCLDKRKVAKQQKANKTKVAAQICHQFKKIKHFSDIVQLSLESDLIDQLLNDLPLEQAEEIYAAINRISQNVELVRRQAEQLLAKGQNIIIDTRLIDIQLALRSDLLQLYEFFAPSHADHPIGIFKNSVIPFAKGRCGRWGIATPEEYYEKLKNYGVSYVNPFKGHSVWKKYKMIINPYGEYYFVKDEKEMTRVPDIIKEFLSTGGIWIHAGGYPFYAAFFWKKKREQSDTIFIAEEIGLEIAQTGQMSVGTIIPDGVGYLGRINWRCENGVRSLVNADRVFAAANVNEKQMNVLATKVVGKGLFVHYGGLHPINTKESEKITNMLCQLIKSIWLERH